MFWHIIFTGFGLVITTDRMTRASDSLNNNCKIGYTVRVVQHK